MLSNNILIKNKKYSLYYNLKCKLNKKYKKVNKYNKYMKIYNPRQEICNFDNLFIKKYKFYKNNKNY